MNHCRRLNYFSLLPENRISGLILPGVDGDFIELALPDEESWQAIHKLLMEECARVNIEFCVVNESEFKHLFTR
jgi:hypothetical protein